MPDVLRVRYLGDAPALIPLAGREVEPDNVFTVPGKVVGEGADHVLVEVGTQTVALATALFAVETPPKRRPRAESSNEGTE
jgi:hypothetical protein